MAGVAGFVGFVGFAGFTGFTGLVGASDFALGHASVASVIRSSTAPSTEAPSPEAESTFGTAAWSGSARCAETRRALTATCSSMGSAIGSAMNGTRSDWYTCMAGKTTEAESSPRVAQRTQKVMQLARMGDERPRPMMSTVSSRTIRR